MPEAPEIPEAKDPFERLVAISIAIMAVVLSIIANHGDAAKTDAIIKTTEASNRWAYFQAKSVKDHIERAEVELLSTLNSVATDPARREAVAAKGKAESQRLEQEKTQIKGEAESLQREAMQALKINDRCDLGTLLLQIGVVLASVAIVSRRRAFGGRVCWLRRPAPASAYRRSFSSDLKSLPVNRPRAYTGLRGE